jgi:alkylated DNA repair dioxygenase AlkB
MNMFEHVHTLSRADRLLEYVEREEFNQSRSYLVRYYGECSYTYTGASLPACKMPRYLCTLARQLEDLEGLPSGYFNMVLMNKYMDGKGLGRHRDDEPEITKGSTIASVSLGADRVFSITKGYRGEETQMVLSHGMVVMMRGRSQIDYWHAVLPGSGVRWNLTFRHNALAGVRDEPRKGDERR